MKLAVNILAIAEAASVGGKVPNNAVCRDPDTGVFYQPNEEWVRRGFQHNFEFILAMLKRPEHRK